MGILAYDWLQVFLCTWTECVGDDVTAHKAISDRE